MTIAVITFVAYRLAFIQSSTSSPTRVPLLFFEFHPKYSFNQVSVNTSLDRNFKAMLRGLYLTSCTIS
jgi:hypothetical protein